MGGGFRPPSEGAIPLVLLGSDCPVRAMAPERLSFYGLARPGFQRSLGALAAWARAA